MTMTPEFIMLAFTLILAVVQILAAAVVSTAKVGLAYNASPRDTVRDPGVLAGRLSRAQANLFETLPLFIGAVLIAHVAGRNGALTAWGTALYFWARVVYVPLYAFGVPYVRSLVWVVSLAGLVMVLASLFLV